MTLALMAVRQEVNNFESSVVVQELEFAMNLALYISNTNYAAKPKVNSKHTMCLLYDICVVLIFATRW